MASPVAHDSQPSCRGKRPHADLARPVSPPPERHLDTPSRQHIIQDSQLDKLGEFIIRDRQLVQQLGLDKAIKQRVGRTDWGPLSRTTHHPAHRLLRHYRTHGAPVTLADPPWSQHEIAGAMARGPHRSAYAYHSFLRDDMADYVSKSYWMVLPYSAVCGHPMLRVSPIGVVPQNKRRPRPIIDYTYYGINAATQPNVPVESMQFGRALERLLRRIVLANPRRGRVKLIKVDLADGFYRVWLSPTDVVKLAVAFPSLPGEPPLIALPLTLPMGWTNSPPFFSTATETVADIANRRLLRPHLHEPLHRLEGIANSPPQDRAPLLAADPTCSRDLPTARDPNLGSSRRRRLHAVEIYVDDFIAAAQGNHNALQRIRRVLSLCIDDVFRPLDHLDAAARKEPISVKKLKQGDAQWSTVKDVLGWIINTKTMTIHLTSRRTSRLRTLLFQHYPRQRKRATIRDWQQLLGELRSMTLALPGARHLFSILQHTLQQTPANHLIKLTAQTHDMLDDFRELFTQLQRRPTRLYELVPLTPTIHGTHDAAGHGMGLTITSGIKEKHFHQDSDPFCHWKDFALPKPCHW